LAWGGQAPSQSVAPPLVTRILLLGDKQSVNAYGSSCRSMENIRRKNDLWGRTFFSLKEMSFNEKAFFDVILTNTFSIKSIFFNEEKGVGRRLSRLLCNSAEMHGHVPDAMRVVKHGYWFLPNYFPFGAD
jgi:hypothetical protein